MHFPPRDPFLLYVACEISLSVLQEGRFRPYRYTLAKKPSLKYYIRVVGIRNALFRTNAPLADARSKMVGDRSMTETAAKEASLIERVLGGDREAFNQLVLRYNESLVGYLSTFNSTRSDADDVAQKVWLWIWTHRARYDPAKGKTFYDWVRGIARNVRRRPKLNRPIEQPGIPDNVDTEGTPVAHGAPKQTPVTILIEEERLHQLHLAYSELFRLLFRCGGYPHEQLGYALAKLIYGRQSNRTIEGDAVAADTEYGMVELEQLAKLFCEEYQAAMGLRTSAWPVFPGEDLRPLQIRLTYTVQEMRPRQTGALSTIQGTVVAYTHLRDYYARGNRKTHPISDWCSRVEGQLRRIVGASKMRQNKCTDGNAPVQCPRAVKARVCNRCKLRNLRPCSTERRQAPCRRTSTGV